MLFPIDSLEELTDEGLSELLHVVEQEIAYREIAVPDNDEIPDEIFDPADNGNQGS